MSIQFLYRCFKLSLCLAVATNVAFHACAQSLAPIDWGAVERDPVAVPQDELNPEVRQVIEDLKKLDAVVYDGDVTGKSSKEGLSVLDGTTGAGIESQMINTETGDSFATASLESREIYRDYLIQSQKIRDDLLDIKAKMDATQWTLSLQQLGALSQGVSAQNTRFSRMFHHGEEGFRSYQLIEQAVHSLEEAIQYWRLSQQYKKTFRETAREQAADDQVLRIKLQTALTAIEDLKALKDMQLALKKLDSERYP